MDVRLTEAAMWLRGNDSEICTAAAAFEAMDMVHRVTVTPEHDEADGHHQAEAYVEVTP